MKNSYKIFAYVVGNSLIFLILGVPIGETFFGLTVPSKTVCQQTSAFIIVIVSVVSRECKPNVSLHALESVGETYMQALLLCPGGRGHPAASECRSRATPA